MEVRPESPSDGCVRPVFVGLAGGGAVAVECRPRRAIDAPPEHDEEGQAGAHVPAEPQVDVQRPPVFRLRNRAEANSHAEPRRTQRKAAVAKATLAHRQKVRRLAAYRAATPGSAICRIFGGHCQEALQVSRCESGLRTTAQNGQYLGLFQMGSSERRIYGHGATAIAQATAAHRYFVDSGSNWGPWSCKPWS